MLRRQSVSWRRRRVAPAAQETATAATATSSTTAASAATTFEHSADAEKRLFCFKDYILIFLIFLFNFNEFLEILNGICDI